jgi:hypothetical protein
VKEEGGGVGAGKYLLVLSRKKKNEARSSRYGRSTR